MILFISDLHLEAARADITQAFFRYLKNLPAQTEALYILGDLFEVWVGDDDHSEFNIAIISALREANNRVPIYIMAGNRDFLYGKEFEQLSHCKLINDPTLIHHRGHDYLLIHGDSLCTEDHSYMAFRAQVRSPDWQQQILALPLEQRHALARELREGSQEANTQKSMDIMDVTPSEVIKIMREYRVTNLIHGHTHRPGEHTIEVSGHSAKRWVLGDWDKEGWQIQIDDNGPVLSRFPLK